MKKYTIISICWIMVTVLQSISLLIHIGFTLEYVFKVLVIVLCGITTGLYIGLSWLDD